MFRVFGGAGRGEIVILTDMDSDLGDNVARYSDGHYFAMMYEGVTHLLGRSTYDCVGPQHLRRPEPPQPT